MANVKYGPADSGRTISVILLPYAGTAPAQHAEMARILLVDDDPSIRTVVSLMLQRAGHCVTVASNGKESVALAEDQAPELVLSDLCMPEITGDEVLRAIKRIAPCAICILMTGDADQSTEFPDLDAQFLKKPFSMVTLIQTVESALCAAK